MGRRRHLPAPPRRTALGWSLALHALLLLPWLGSQPARRDDRPLAAFAVEASLLQHAAPPTPPPAAPPCAVAPEPQDDPADALAAAALPLEPPPAPAAAPPTPPAARPRLADHALRRLRAQPAAAAEPPATAVAAPSAPPPAAADRPHVPVPIPGQNPCPEYPAAAVRRRLEGTVVVRIEVDRDGAAAQCAVVAGSGSALLDGAALAAARRWRFDRGPGVVEQAFVFRLAARRSDAAFPAPGGRARPRR